MVRPRSMCSSPFAVVLCMLVDVAEGRPSCWWRGVGNRFLFLFILLRLVEPQVCGFYFFSFLQFHVFHFQLFICLHVNPIVYCMG